MRIVLLDSGLELVPPEMNYKGNSLLDINYHYRSMKRLRDWYKRGRPDIVHFSLLQLLSWPTFSGEIYVHTFDGKVIYVDRKTRIPKSQARFNSLIVQLLKYGKVPTKGEPLMVVTSYRLNDVINQPFLLFDERGDLTFNSELCGNVSVGIGAFQRGEFSDEVLSIPHKKISVSKSKIETFQVVCNILQKCFPLE
ncbi:16S rRNA methyltransferase [Sulfolobales archaeon HS-7]|nr:16S rRNA methyltransferase [Sulfolobales archaeon HS-7]